jgi:hypothetical protein
MIHTNEYDQLHKILKAQDPLQQNNQILLANRTKKKREDKQYI